MFLLMFLVLQFWAIGSVDSTQTNSPGQGSQNVGAEVERYCDRIGYLTGRCALE